MFKTELNTNVQQTELVDGLNNVSNKIYHDDRKYLSSSVLKTILESLEKYFHDYICNLKPANSSSTQNNFDVGTLVHSMILEPHTVATDFNFYKGFRKQGKEWNDFLTSCKDSKKPIISVNQHAQATRLYEAFSKLPEAVKLIAGGAAEQTICGTLHGVPIKTRFDWSNPDGERGYIMDVKTTGYGSDLESFKSAIDSFKYDLSASLYLQMAEQFYGKPFDFFFVVLSKKDNTCDVYKLSSRTRAEGYKKVKQACEKYLLAKATNVWTDDVLQGTISTSASMDEAGYIIQEV